MLSRSACLLTLVLALAACSSTGETQSGQHIGSEMRSGQPIRFAIVDATPTKFFDQTVLVEATVKAVCQNQGCWMQIEDQGHTALIRWETGCGGKYAFPKDAVGKHVIVQGSFSPKPVDAQELEHMRQESSGKMSLQSDGYEFNATSVLVLDEAK